MQFFLAVVLLLFGVTDAEEVIDRSALCPTTTAKTPNAVFTMWIDDDYRRRLLPREFRDRAVDRARVWACSARAASISMPLYIISRFDDLCDTFDQVLDFSWFDTRSIFKAIEGGQRRTDGWKTAYKFVLWNMTAFERILYYDLDTIVLSDPSPFVSSARQTFVAAVECGRRGYVGLNTHLMLLRPNKQIFTDLVKKSQQLDYAAVTNTEQDVLEAYWCPYISEFPRSIGIGTCAKHLFNLTTHSSALFLSAKKIAFDYAPHIHDARLDISTCEKWTDELGTDRAPCTCLVDRKSRDDSHEDGDIHRRRLNNYGKCEALLDSVQ